MYCKDIWPTKRGELDKSSSEIRPPFTFKCLHACGIWASPNVLKPVPYKDVSTWDFCTPYTTTCHKDVIEGIRSSIVSVFTKQRSPVDLRQDNKAFFSFTLNVITHGMLHYLLIYLKFLNNNIYVKFVEKTTEQVFQWVTCVRFFFWRIWIYVCTKTNKASL